VANDRPGPYNAAAWANRSGGLQGLMKVLIVVGTRPEAIKMAPVHQALAADPDRFEVRLCLTAQHRALLDQVIDVFQLPVAYDLNLMTPGQTLFDTTGRVLHALGGILEDAQPDGVLVHGDTTTSFAAALAAYYKQIPVGHVEAGLRTYDKFRPFPEEMNRRLADALCDWHYAPTPGARENLLSERIAPEHIVVTGNTVIDALLQVAGRPYAFADPLLETLGTERRLILVTAHRRESFGTPFAGICRAIRSLADAYEDTEYLYPVHPNPRVQECVREHLSDHPRIHLIEPLDYLPFVHLLKKAYLVLTDSGGIQEEAPALNKPVLVLRDVTERPEAIEAGAARLAGTDPDAIVAAVRTLLDDGLAYQAMAGAPNPYGDGQAAARIAAHLASVAENP